MRLETRQLHPQRPCLAPDFELPDLSVLVSHLTQRVSWLKALVTLKTLLFMTEWHCFNTWQAFQVIDLYTYDSKLCLVISMSIPLILWIRKLHSCARN